MVRGSVLIVNPNQLFREGLRYLLLKARFTVSGEGKNLIEAVEVIKRAGPGKPVDLMILALEPGCMESDLAQVGLIRRDFPAMKLVALTASLSSAEFLQAMRAGVDAILTHDISSGVLQASLELVLQSQQVLLAPMDHLLAGAMLGARAEPAAAEPDGRQDEKRGAEEASNLVPFTPLRSMGGTPPAPVRVAPAPVPSAEPPHPQSLSQRESQILHCLVKGFSNKAIARELEVAETTVKVHVKGLMRKMRASNRTQVAIWAMNYHLTAEEAAAHGGSPAVDFGHKAGARPGIVAGLPDQSRSA